MSVQYDITAEYLIKSGYRPIHAGDDYDHSFTVNRSGSPLDLTSAKLWLTIKEDIEDEDSEAKLQYDSTNPAEIEISVTPTDGSFVIHWPREGSSAFLMALSSSYQT
jgi:hypothetical protein